MKKFVIKIVSLLCCLAMLAGMTAACDQPNSNETKPNTDATTPSGTAPECYFEALDQRASNDGRIIVSYDVTADVADDYDHIEVRVYHDDENNRLLCATNVDATKRTAYVDTSYGKLRMELVGVKADGSATVLANETAKVWADEYNFASLNGTFPVVYFTLELFSMNGDSRENFVNANANGKNIQFLANVPTFVSLERTAAYNWEKLPENVYTLPNTTYEHAVQGDFHGMNTKMAAYIKELNEINPESKFHFYCVDNYPELIVKFFTAQGVDDDHFDATMISDGTASVSAFMDLYKEDGSETTYEEMKKAWETIKDKAAKGEQDYLSNVLNGSTDGCSILWKYAITMVNEEDNIQWWCSRDNFTKNTESQYMKDVLANVKGTKLQYFGINDMLSNLSADDQSYLKELFHFDGEMFSAAEESGKKALVLIGTSTSDEVNIAEYVKLVKALYGEEYVIYYKGHPGYPTGLYAEKTELFEKYGVTDIDASIAAELILFYCPDIYLAGWPSTTYKSAHTDKLLALFDQTMESGLNFANTDGYGDTPDSCFSVVEVSGKKYVKIEYAADDAVKYFDTESLTFIDKLPA